MSGNVSTVDEHKLWLGQLFRIWWKRGGDFQFSIQPRKKITDGCQSANNNNVVHQITPQIDWTLQKATLFSNRSNRRMNTNYFESLLGGGRGLLLAAGNIDFWFFWHYENLLHEKFSVRCLQVNFERFSKAKINFSKFQFLSFQNSSFIFKDLKKILFSTNLNYFPFLFHWIFCTEHATFHFFVIYCTLRKTSKLLSRTKFLFVVI